MALNLPKNATEVELRAKTDVQRELPTSNPFLKNHWLGALITSYSNRIYDFYLQLLEVQKQAFPDTATGIILARWAAIWGRNRLAATTATGNIVATGTNTTVIPISTTFTASDGQLYDSTASVTITTAVLVITSITRSGTTATVTSTLANHGLSNNVQVIIAGAVETDYNGTFSIQVTALNKFTFTVPGSPTTPATGTITATHTSIPVPVISQGFGLAVNQDLGALLTLQSPIVNVDDDAGVDFGAIGGGANQELDTDLRIRLLERIQNPVSHFNVNEIVSQAKLIAGVTRVFVQEITPAVGQVTIYFMRDNDANPIPDSSEVITVKSKIVEIKPVNTATTDVIVLAPNAVTIPFTLSALSPNTSTMKTSITASLQQFFDENTQVGVDVDQDAYRSAIFNTVDTETGDQVSSFTLSTPIADITIDSGEIGVLGAIVYP